MSESHLTVLSLTFLVLLVSSRIVKLVRGLKSVDHLPGIRCLFCPLALPGVLLPNRSWNPGLTWTWYWRSFVYRQYKSETISVVPYLLGRPVIYTSSPEVAQQVLGSNLFDKTPDTTYFLSAWGENVISVASEKHKRHRRIVGPAFSGAIAPLVWEKTLQTYQEMMADERWSKQTTVSIDCINDYTHKFALIIIARCGLGLSLPWTASSSSDGEANLEKHMASVSNNIAIRGMVPRWMYKLPIKKLAEVENVFVTLGNSMMSLVASQKARLAAKTWDVDSKPDLFSRIVQANEEEGKLALDDDEVVGNFFAFLLAGHGEKRLRAMVTAAEVPEVETTARSITTTLALLALHPEEQDIAVENIQRVLVDGRDPDYDDYNALSKVMACFLEAMRMYPAVYVSLRDSTESVKLTTPTDNGDKTYVLPPGTRVVVDTIGICNNPRHFPDPDVYKPSRWHSAAESEVSVFGLGPRACIGRKFAMAESVCFLTVLLRDWVVSPLLRDGETVGEWRSRVMRVEWGITFGVGSVPLRLTKRV